MGSLGVALLGRPLTPRRPNIAVQSASRSQRAAARDSAGGRVEMGKRRGAESKRRDGISESAAPPRGEVMRMSVEAGQVIGAPGSLQVVSPAAGVSMIPGCRSPFRRRHIFAVAAGMLRFRGMSQSRSELHELSRPSRLSLVDETTVDLG